MGKFDGVLIVSDFDNTMAYTEGALRAGTAMPPLSAKNREAIQYFMANGGTFSVATGRSLPSFEQVRGDIPMNGPSVLFNGAAIYDFAAGRYLHTAFLPEKIRGHIDEVLTAMPGLCFKLYHNDNAIYVVNPSELSRSHQHLTHQAVVTLPSVWEAPSPILKIAFQEETDVQAQICTFIDSRPWKHDYEVVSSSNHLLEVTVTGANKGGMTEKLAQLLGIDRRHVYAMGDHANDIPMLTFARQGFCPENAIDSVKAVPGIRVLPNCWEDATTAMIKAIDKLY